MTLGEKVVSFVALVLGEWCTFDGLKFERGERE
jgi:hypothetical protein